MDGKSYLALFIGLFILVIVVGATAGSLLNAISGTWNGTHYVGGLGTGVGGVFTSTGLGSLFGVTIAGLLLAAAVFYGVWAMIAKK